MHNQVDFLRLGYTHSGGLTVQFLSYELHRTNCESREASRYMYKSMFIIIINMYLYRQSLLLLLKNRTHTCTCRSTRQVHSLYMQEEITRVQPWLIDVIMKKPQMFAASAVERETLLPSEGRALA